MGVMFGAAGHSQDALPIPQIYEECSAGSRGYVSKWTPSALNDCFLDHPGPQTREVCLYLWDFCPQ